MRYRPLIVLVLGVIFAGSLYLGFSLQGQAEVNPLSVDQFVEQLNAGAFVALEQYGALAHGETATGDVFAAEFGQNAELEGALVAAGAEEAAVTRLLAASEGEPLGVRLARTLLWVGPLLLFLCLVFIVWKGQGASENE